MEMARWPHEGLEEVPLSDSPMYLVLKGKRINQKKKKKKKGKRII